jgi:2-oxoglutarate dehydrogenase E2 component (dihydrolipoamide succinyltransferase)
MSKFELLMPKLGESVQEATITKWFVKEGDKIDEDDLLLEIATDKVDSEIPSPVEGVVTKIFFKVDELVPVGTVIAIISLDGEEEITPTIDAQAATEINEDTKEVAKLESADKATRFYSPLVKNIAAQENISITELESISGSGANGRVQKQDVLEFISKKSSVKKVEKPVEKVEATVASAPVKPKIQVSVNAGDEIIQMDRMRKMIAENMVHSKHVAAHVTNMVECDVTNIVLWRERVKDDFMKREKVKLTYLPIFLEAIARGLKEFPMINSAVDGETIIIRKDINLGVAVALPTNNLIVPVIKKADQLNLIGLTKELTRIADAARSNKLSPDDVVGGTFSVSNFGTFRNVMGTPVIAQPQVAIMAVGTIEKKPAVVETPTGDIIAIRHKMFLSLTYDHRIIDGALGGAFLRRVGDIIEEFDLNRGF